MSFDEKQVDVKADPCLKHTRIGVEVAYGNTLRGVISLENCYNSLLCSNIRPWALYSGLLQVLDQICNKENGKFLTSQKKYKNV